MLPASRNQRHVKFEFKSWLRSLFVVLAILVGSVTALDVAEAAPVRVRVRGTAKLVARGSRYPSPGDQQGLSELLLSGSLLDDAGHPLATQAITVRVTREANPHDVIVEEGIRGAHGCDRPSDSAPAPPPRRGPTSWAVRVVGPTDAPEVLVVTDEDGRFCFRAKVPPDRYKAQLTYTPTAAQSLVDGIEREITFDLTKRGLALRFDPTPKIVQLDAPRTTIEAIAILDDEANPRLAPGLPVVLANEREEVSRAVTDAAGRARFVVFGSKLGPVGPGELRVSFAGDGTTARTSHTEEIERHVSVVIKVPTADRNEIPEGVPEDGIPLLVEVGSSLGPVPEGSVEARVGDVVVGASPVERGIARLMLTFTAQGNDAVVRLRYVPASPWYEPLGEPTVHVPVRGPTLLSKAPILLAGLAVLAFFLVGRVSAQKSKPEPVPAQLEPTQVREGRPRVQVIRPAERGQEGWSGRVVDAHEAVPVRGARVWIERGTFEGRSVLASVETDSDGRFVLPGIGPVVGDESIAAEARLHARHTQDLPAPGEISISLAQRRRALLAKLVSWARRRGPPFDARPEPTPGHVRRAASGELATARWADAIERAVFGPSEIDARAEQELVGLEPQDRHNGELASLRAGSEHEKGDTPAQKAPPNAGK